MPLGGRGWHPIFRAASPLPDVPIPPRIQSRPSPADTPQRQPNPHPFPDMQAPPRLALSCTATSSQPPSDTPPIFPYRPVPLPHYAHAPPRGRRTRPPPLLSNPSAFAYSASLVSGGAAAGGPARSSHAPSLPRAGEGRAPFTLGALGSAPFSRMLNGSWEEGAGPSGIARL